MSDHYDAIVIGTGQAGPSLAVRLAKAGRKTAIIERKRFGGTCVNNGCIPTKTLIASARAAHVARTAGGWGVVVPPGMRVDMPAVKARKDAVVRHRARASPRGCGKRRASPSSKATPASRDRTRCVSAPRCSKRRRSSSTSAGVRIVAGIAGIGDVPYLDNVTMMDVDALPRHLVVIGGSYVGLEFAQMYRRFGAEVTVIEMGSALIGREDAEVSAAVKDILEAEGIAIRLDAKCLAVRAHRDGVAVGIECAQEPREVVGSRLLLATGRRPNTDDLGCERAGFALDERGYIVVDDALRTNVDGIYALGDVNGRGAFTHTAYNDYEIVAANLLDGESRRVADRIPAYALFIDPPLGRAGMTEREVREKGIDALVATMPMTRVGRAKERGETAGFMKVLVDAGSKRLLGAALLGIEGDEVIHSLLDVMYAGAPYTVIERAMHIHPTVTELVPTLLGQLKPLS